MQVEKNEILLFRTFCFSFLCFSLTHLLTDRNRNRTHCYPMKRCRLTSKNTNVKAHSKHHNNRHVLKLISYCPSTQQTGVGSDPAR